MLELRGVCWRLLGEHFGALGAASGPLGSARESIFEHFGPFWGVILEYLFRARWQLESSSILLLLQTCFYVFSDFAIMADIVPDL